MIWIDVRRDRYRPLRGLDSILSLDPGAHAPGLYADARSAD